MKSNLTTGIYCSTFGHNLNYSKSLNNSKDELICKNCNAKIIRDINCDSSQNKPSQKEFRALLLQLYTLTRLNILRRI